jgi:hypothetical protein
MSNRELHLIADALSQRYHSFDEPGPEDHNYWVQFGIEEAVLALTEMIQATDPFFNADQFRSACCNRAIL